MLPRSPTQTDFPPHNRFRRMRRASHETFGPHSATRFLTLQEREAVRLTAEILAEPDNWEIIVKR